MNIDMKSVFLKLIRVRNVQVAVVLGLLTFAVIHSFLSWLPKILANNGFSPTMAGYLILDSARIRNFLGSDTAADHSIS